MNKSKATQLAQSAVSTVAVGQPVPVAGTTVLFLNADGTYSVTDNGEEAIARTKAQAVEFIIGNLTA